jgi:hypothetical protein
MSSIAKKVFGRTVGQTVSRRSFTVSLLFDSRPLHVGFVVDKVPLKQAFLSEYFGLAFQYYSTNAPYSFIYHRRCITSAVDSVVKKDTPKPLFIMSEPFT